jgi:beta-barrel assembly-enhancing protease
MRWRFPVLLLILAVCGGALYYSQQKKQAAEAGPGALVNLVADTQREMSRVPMRLTRLSDTEEIQIGDEIARGYLSSMPKATSAADQAFEQYLQTIGGRLAARANRKLPYKFHYVADASFLNAFALPGGHIFFGKGLAMAMDSEDQIAAVLGHEIEHIDQYHCAERVQIEARLRHIPLARVAQLPIMLFQAGYTKEQEFESDRQGTLLAMKSGYSAYGAVRVFEIFEGLRKRYAGRAKNPPAELTQVAFRTLLEYFRSHPLPAERKQRIETLINSMNVAARAEQPMKVSPA